MNLQVIAFTARGAALAVQLAKQLPQAQAFAMEAYAPAAGAEPVKACKVWAKEAWQEASGLIFVGATGIAVRTIAPLLCSKTKDPAVVVVDEGGQFAISLVSGHLGGANELAMQVARAIDAVPVITTATDVNAKFAVDVFAKRNQLAIGSMEKAKQMSAAILSGQSIGLFSQLPMQGTVPPELTVEQLQTRNLEIGLQARHPESLLLIPQCMVLGIGCKRGTSAEKIAAAVEQVLQQHQIPLQAVARAASIDLKQEEPGLLAFLHQRQIPAVFYDAKTLNQLPGAFSRSAFVNQITGVDCVCERAALTACGDGTLIVPKHASDGVTVAVARREMRIQF